MLAGGILGVWSERTRRPGCRVERCLGEMPPGATSREHFALTEVEAEVETRRRVLNGIAKGIGIWIKPNRYDGGSCR